MEDKEKHPVLYLIPSGLGNIRPSEVLPQVVKETLRRCRHFIVEDVRTARRFIRSVDKSIGIDQLKFFLLNEHTQAMEIPGLLEPLHQGYDMGLLSEAGLPCVADPGSLLVSLAHQAGFVVKPLPGASSIMLGLMASGFNGQKFIFHGYLPVDKRSRKQKIREMEADMMQHDRTQILIETPYRNNQLVQSLVTTCKPSTLLCIASNLTTEQEKITVKSIAYWKDRMPDLNKIPAVFLLYY